MSMPATNSPSRREFLTTSSALAAVAGLQAIPGLNAGLFAAPDKPETPADRPPVRLALMGVNSRGKQLIQAFEKVPNVEFAYIIDPDSNTIPSAVKLLKDKGHPEPKIEKDFRRALEDKSVTALVCAAPDHWHALATIWACQAGKDVYVEKPCCHNPAEGRMMIEAARKYQRVVQVGMQRRSATELGEIRKVIQAGTLGDVRFARCWITSERPSIGKVAASAPPANLDFNLWAGPGSAKEYKTNLVHYHWHWRWDYGTGECGNNGIHALDVARWGLGVETPRYVSCGGDRYFFDDDQETPDTQLATFDFKDAAIQWEHRTWSPRGLEGENFGVIFYGSKASLVTHGNGWTIYGGKKGQTEIEKRAGTDMMTNHLNNFVDAIRTREKPYADIETAHQSTLLCHLANISWRTRSTLELSPGGDQILNNPAAQALMSREYRPEFSLPKTL